MARRVEQGGKKCGNATSAVESSPEKSGFFCDAGNILVFSHPFIVTTVDDGAYKTFRQNLPCPLLLKLSFALSRARARGTLTLFGRRARCWFEELSIHTCGHMPPPPSPRAESLRIMYKGCLRISLTFDSLSLVSLSPTAVVASSLLSSIPPARSSQ